MLLYDSVEDNEDTLGGITCNDYRVYLLLRSGGITLSLNTSIVSGNS